MGDVYKGHDGRSVEWAIKICLLNLPAIIQTIYNIIIFTPTTRAVTPAQPLGCQLGLVSWVWCCNCYSEATGHCPPLYWLDTASHPASKSRLGYSLLSIQHSYWSIKAGQCTITWQLNRFLSWTVEVGCVWGFNWQHYIELGMCKIRGCT